MSLNDTVREGYQVIAETYHAGRLAREAVNGAWLDTLRPMLPATGKVVDLGCGAGVPITRYFAERGYDVQGFDLSPAMLEIARREVPQAKFTEARIEDLSFEPASLDIVTSFFAIIHVHREHHAELFRRIFGWLKPGGIALMSLGAADNPNQFDENWNGAAMSWSHFDADTNLRLLTEGGFLISWSALESFGPKESHLFVLASRPS
jgi:SAM-dependent methyltransferase